MIKFTQIITILGLTLCLLGCKPDKIELEIYSSDIERAAKNEIVNIPITVTFSILGDDEEGYLKKAGNIAKKYLGEKSEIIQSKGETGDIITIKSSIPFGTAAAIEKHINSNPSPLVLEINQNQIMLGVTPHKDRLNKELESLNPMFDFEKEAVTTALRIIGDTRNSLKIEAISVFVDGKAHAMFRKAINHRQTVTLEYKGEAASIYSQHPIFLFADVVIENK